MINKAKQKLQMPPYLPITPDEPKILDECPEMKGFTEYKYLFTDISVGKDPLVSKFDFSYLLIKLLLKAFCRSVYSHLRVKFLAVSRAYRTRRWL